MAFPILLCKEMESWNYWELSSHGTPWEFVDWRSKSSKWKVWHCGPSLASILQILTTSQMLLLSYFNDVTHKALNISSFSSEWKENGADEPVAQITSSMSPFIFIHLLLYSVLFCVTSSFLLFLLSLEDNYPVTISLAFWNLTQTSQINGMPERKNYNTKKSTFLVCAYQSHLKLTNIRQMRYA